MQKILRSLLLGLSLLLLVAGTARAQSDADREAIKQTALDYIEGYYNGDAERMERSLHPDLAKRIARTNPSTGKSNLNHMTAAQLIQGTRMRQGRPTPKEQQQRDITILDVYENVASVKIVANDWIDYLHEVKFDGRWVIINVLWEMKPKSK
ncbi:MAG: nuclear transport factor 2 family protein [Acidobacteria bacterium]|nr:nuclear transport factor 2 family protein [Acidobacteriota bacterium]